MAMEAWVDDGRTETTNGIVVSKDSPHSLTRAAPELQRQLCVPAGSQAPIPMRLVAVAFIAHRLVSGHPPPPSSLVSPPLPSVPRASASGE
jgi:hypothetical protein